MKHPQSVDFRGMANHVSRLADLVAGKHLEAFAEARGARYAVVARQVELIAKPGDKPTFTGKE